MYIWLHCSIVHMAPLQHACPPSLQLHGLLRVSDRSGTASQGIGISWPECLACRIVAAIGMSSLQLLWYCYYRWSITRANKACLALPLDARNAIECVPV